MNTNSDAGTAHADADADARSITGADDDDHRNNQSAAALAAAAVTAKGPAAAAAAISISAQARTQSQPTAAAAGSRSGPGPGSGLGAMTSGDNSGMISGSGGGRAGTDLFSPIQTQSASAAINISNASSSNITSNININTNSNIGSSNVSGSNVSGSVYATPADLAGLLQRASIGTGTGIETSMSIGANAVDVDAVIDTANIGRTDNIGRGGGGGVEGRSSGGGRNGNGNGKANVGRKWEEARQHEEGAGADDDSDDDDEFGGWQGQQQAGEEGGGGGCDADIRTDGGGGASTSTAAAAAAAAALSASAPASNLPAAGTAQTPPRPKTKPMPPPPQPLPQPTPNPSAAAAAAQLPPLPQLRKLPDVQDRKRIVGCLAGILAELYSHDDSGDGIDDSGDVGGVSGDGGNRQQQQQQQQSASASAESLQAAMSEDNGDQDEAEGEEDSDEGSEEESPRLLNRYDSRPVYSDLDDSNGNDNDNCNRIEEEEEGEFDDEFFDDSYYGDDAILTTSPSSTLGNRRVRQAPTTASARGPLPPAIPDQSLSMSMPVPPEQQQQQNQKQSQPPTQRQTMQNQLTSAPSRLFPRRHRRHTTELAIRRHRLRRYEVMSELLLSSAECLGLEERDVRGFMIMLDPIKTGGNGNGSGGGARQQQAQQSQTKTASRRGRRSARTTTGTGSTGLMPIVGIAGGMEADDSLNASYTSGTVDASGWGDNPGSSRLQQRRQQAPINLQREEEEQIQEQVPAYDESLEADWTNISMLSPFLSDLTPGAGFQCVSLLLLQHLLRSKSGYDARVRQVYKRLAVIVLMWEEKARYDVLLGEEVSDAGSSGFGFAEDTGSDAASEGVEIRTDASGEVLGIHHSPSTGEMSTSFAGAGTGARKRSLRPTDSELAAKATRKFEALERTTASKLITLSNQQSSRRQKQKQHTETDVSPAAAAHKAGAGKASVAAATSQQHRPQQPQQQPQPQPHGHPPAADSRRQRGEQPVRSKHSRSQQESSQRQQRPHAASAPPKSTDVTVANRTGPRITRGQVMRGLKIGSAGVAAGALFALTGGLAAPGIAAGIAAMTASTTITAAGAAVVSTLTSTAAVCTIFGVGGGGLAAYKVSRRTAGITEFEFRREDNGRARVRAEKAAVEARKAAAGSNLRRRLRGTAEHDAVAAAARAAAAQTDAELFSTVCLSGWFKDVRDFQRPWGVNPNNPPITDLLEILERFYAKYQPSKIHRCSRILAHWRGEERQLWRLLKQKYGKNPDESFPFNEGPRFDGDLTDIEDEAIDCLLRELGYDIPEPEHPHHTRSDEGNMDHGKDGLIGRIGQKVADKADKIIHHNYEGHGAEDLSRMENMANPIGTEAAVASSVGGRRMPAPAPKTAPAALRSAPTPGGTTNAGVPTGSAVPTGASNTASGSGSGSDTVQSLPRHLNTVWDYTAEYGGELYTVRWESDLLMELCDSVTDMVVDVLGAGTRELLKQTALATLVTAIAIPYAMVRAADSIDSVWTLAVERADEAGVELAKSLLDSQAGHRPVTLLGFSMGARAVYSCLKELARHQEKWEDQRERRREEEETATAAAGDPSSSTSGDGDIRGSSKSTKTNDKKSNRGSSEEERVYLREPASIVEDVILMGLPNHVSLPSWFAARRIVSGRLVNCYSTKDLILSVLFQYKRLTGVLRPVCGCAPVRVPGVENYDITHMLNSHADYTLIVCDVLRLVRHGQPRPTRSLGWFGQDKQRDGDQQQDSQPFSAPLGDERAEPMPSAARSSAVLS